MVTDFRVRQIREIH